MKAEIHNALKLLDSPIKSENDRRCVLFYRLIMKSNIGSLLPWLRESSNHFGKIKADLERRGELIDDFDIAIGAIALSYGCGVITANISHFQRITNLECLSYQ